MINFLNPYLFEQSNSIIVNFLIKIYTKIYDFNSR
jgi:hypothetical protein